MRNQWERFRDASVVLAGGGTIRSRLHQAFQEHLAGLSADDLSGEAKGQYQALLAALHSCRRTGTRDAMSVSILKMSEAEACRHAQDIVRIFSGLSEPQPANRAAAVLRAVPDSNGLPAFLNRA